MKKKREEREIDKHNHKLELIRTILPVIIIILQNNFR